MNLDECRLLSTILTVYIWHANWAEHLAWI